MDQRNALRKAIQEEIHRLEAEQAPHIKPKAKDKWTANKKPMMRLRRESKRLMKQET
jgi:hypothetical protein